MRVRLRARLEVTFLAAMAWSAPAQDTPFRTDRCRLGLTRLHLMALSSLATLAIPFASAKIMCANGWALRRGGPAIPTTRVPRYGATCLRHQQSSTPSI